MACPLALDSPALAANVSSQSANAPDYDDRLFRNEELRLRREREHVAKLRADNTEGLNHLIQQQTDRIHGNRR
ncbi:hypothetical protein FS749_003184 [Ceratobasidium sp. UAMH 11750]|nr:hypothetical protein FS749_003184 [Ceratobasidium sp. UAMH 11750]